MASATVVPPGSLVWTTLYPARRRARARCLIWVLFPLPSGPSRVMKSPRLAGFLDDRFMPFPGVEKMGRIVFQVIENSKKLLATAYSISV